MRKRFNFLAVGIVLAILSFAYARYDYSNKNSATLTIGKHESTTVTNPFMDKSFFGDWMKDEMLFAIVLPIAFIAGGVGLAIRK
jgi:hypothetical protein